MLSCLLHFHVVNVFEKGLQGLSDASELRRIRAFLTFPHSIPASPTSSLLCFIMHPQPFLVVSFIQYLLPYQRLNTGTGRSCRNVVSVASESMTRWKARRMAMMDASIDSSQVYHAARALDTVS